MAKKAVKKTKTAMVKVKLVKSPIGSTAYQREVLRGLGLRRINHVVERQDTPEIRGMVSRVLHLVEVLDS